MLSQRSGLGTSPNFQIFNRKLSVCWDRIRDFPHFKRDEALFINVTEGFVTSGSTKQE